MQIQKINNQTNFGWKLEITDISRCEWPGLVSDMISEKEIDRLQKIASLIDFKHEIVPVEIGKLKRTDILPGKDGIGYDLKMKTRYGVVDKKQDTIIPKDNKPFGPNALSRPYDVLKKWLTEIYKSEKALKLAKEGVETLDGKVVGY